MNATKRAILSRLASEHFRQLAAFVQGADDAVRGIGSAEGLPDRAREQQVKQCSGLAQRIVERGIACDPYVFGGKRDDVDRAAVLRALVELEAVGFVVSDGELIRPTIRGIEVLLRYA